jgi:site-specific recombinase XerD
MNLQQLIEQYIAYRKSLGECQDSNGRTLRAFGHFIGAGADIADVRAEQVDAFLLGKGPRTLTWHIKLSVLRPFYRYAVSRGYATVSPLPTVTAKRPPPFVPYIYSHEDLRRLLQATDSHPHRQGCLEPVTLRTIVLLLYGTGLRVQEAVDLNRADVDLDGALLIVRQTKFDKTRLVPFGPQLGDVLTRYDARTQACWPETPFFTTRTGTRVKPDTLQHNYRLLCSHAGVCRSDGARFQPRLHDLRHTFAVHRLTSWYQQGADVQRLLPLLSVYLGHVHIRHTQVYLSMTPELLHEASKRFEQYAGKEQHHD